MVTMTECSFGGDQGGEGSERGTQLTLVSTVCADSGTVPCCDPLPVREAAPNYRVYPPPLAKYEEVAADSKLFMETLEKLHSTLGTKFMVPTIGGKELDLHRLFVEVTSRGGLERIIRDRKWKDITAVFSFPSTATNASFVLRKYYISLIHHYEQIYFFRALGWTSPPTATLPVSSPFPAQGMTEPVLPSLESTGPKRKRSSGEVLVGAPQSTMNCPVVGIIDGKFEYGYLVTVTVGTEKLKGVLYHVPEYSVGQAPQYFGLPNSCGNDATASGVRRRRRRKKTEMRKRDPSHPKPNRSGYNFFFAEQHARLKPLHLGKDREISRMIGELWNKLTKIEKTVYQERGVKDKERYRSEMEEYREGLKALSPVISHALPIQQRLAVPELPMVEVDSKMQNDRGELGAGQFPITLWNGVSMKLEDKSSEPGVSLAGGSGARSPCSGTEPAIEEDGFELRRRDNDGKEREVTGSGSGGAVESAARQ